MLGPQQSSGAGVVAGGPELGTGSIPPSGYSRHLSLYDTIKSAHASFPNSSCRELSAHDIRGIATSMLLWKNCSVPTILRAAC
ncbi:hypothetical protein E2C01_039324 [Portunus trituberculatus]|uniref:Uncharacterized protein n=1 Tax=Portunus trituberculatus TaxID=210409 RepID=A0A5B7FKI0_PORTR|nr:hypothetical protein [Portunus trituberculatus]